MAAAAVPSVGPNTVEQSLPQLNGAPLNGSAEKSENAVVQELAACSSPAGPAVKSQRKFKRKQKSPFEQACAWVVDRQLHLSILFITAVTTSHLFLPFLRWETDKFFHLQYYNPKTGRYGKGWDDMFFVLMWIMIFFGVRVAFMEYLAAPFAKWAKIQGRKEHIRFAEQAWVFFYDGSMWSLGFYIIYNSEYWMNMDGMWTNWPIRETDALFKWYYLVQFAFWLQQIVVVNIEERRKDHWQMFTHHIVTCFLLFGSYAYHQTRVGNVILCLMDFVDIILPLAKMLRYLGLQFACDCAFGVFILGWIVTRHILYNMVCWSIYTRMVVVAGFGCYSGEGENKIGPTDPPESLWYLLEPFRDPNGVVCMTGAMATSFLTFLVTLQVILMMWMALILRLAWKVITGGSADDPRSDDEEEEELDDVHTEKQNGHALGGPLEEEVGAEDMHFRSKGTSRSPNGTRASGVQLPVKKELLNRVGCDTKTK